MRIGRASGGYVQAMMALVPFLPVFVLVTLLIGFGVVHHRGGLR